MKRVCIYVIYDKKNIVHPYIGIVLKELKKFAETIYVICNFDRIVLGNEFVEPFAERILFRENVGFDAGAYRDALTEYIGWDEIEKYDELILSNDTYFAPIYPFDEMFELMGKLDCDFWGVTKQSRGKFKDGYEFEEHIQSYFLCFKQKVLKSRVLRLFWTNWVYASDKYDAIKQFELRLNYYLRDNDFKGLSYMEAKKMDDIPVGANPYLGFSYELIKDARIPILKKTNFIGSNRYLVNSIKALEYVEQKCAYDTNLIKAYLDENRKKGLLGTYYDFEKMREFVVSHKRIYIYGAGVWGKITKEYLESKNLKFESIIVTKAQNESEIEFDSIIIHSEDGIIIAQEKKCICDEIKDYIKDRVKENQIFTPCYPSID